MRGPFRTTITLSALSVWILFPGAALSNDSDSLSKFMACAEIENPPLRYACFDETAAAVKAMQANATDMDVAETPSVASTAVETPNPSAEADLAVNEAEESADEDKGGLFGFIGGLTKQARTPEEFGLDDEPEEAEIVTEITGNISDFRISGTGRIIVLLDNGQIWQQIQGDTTRLQERIMARQTSANIETAAMGTYLMRLSPSEKSIRVRRIQ